MTLDPSAGAFEELNPNRSVFFPLIPLWLVQKHKHLRTSFTSHLFDETCCRSDQLDRDEKSLGGLWSASRRANISYREAALL